MSTTLSYTHTHTHTHARARTLDFPTTTQNGNFWTAEVRPTRQDPNIRSDPTLVPVTMVRAGTEEHQLFATERKLLAMAASTLSHRHRLPAWVPAQIRGPLEDFVGRFLGHVGEQLLRLELSWPREQGWALAGAVLHGVGILYAWWFGMGAQAALAGWVTGALYGVALRTRAERRFDWPAYGPALLLAVLLATILRGFGWVAPGSRRALPMLFLERTLGRVPYIGPVFRIVGLLSHPLLLVVGVWWPFFKDRRSLRVGNHLLLYGLLGLSVVYGFNTFLALGAWYGGLVKAVRERLSTPAAAAAAAATATATATAAATTWTAPTQQQQQQQQQPFTMMPAAGAVPYGMGSPARRPFAGGQQQPQLGFGPPSMAAAPAAEAQAAAAALRFQQQAAAEASHPRRWLEEPEPAPYDDYGSRGLASRRRSTGSGWDGMGSSAAPPEWQGQAAEGVVITEGPRYGLRSRGQRRGSASMLPPPAAAAATAMLQQQQQDDGGEMMDLSESPPPPPVPAHALRSPGFFDRSRRLSDGLGRYETLTPGRY